MLCTYLSLLSLYRVRFSLLVCPRYCFADRTYPPAPDVVISITSKNYNVVMLVFVGQRNGISFLGGGKLWKPCKKQRGLIWSRSG